MLGRVANLVVGLMPRGTMKNRLLNLLGHQIDMSAEVGSIIVVGGARLELGASSRVGTLSAFRAVRVCVGIGGEIGQLNWVTAHPPLVDESESPIAGMLLIGNQSSVTNRHYFDVSGGVEIGEFTTIAGVRSTFMTHGIDAARNGLATDQIRVGNRVMMGGNCCVVLGTYVPDYSVVGMGSVVVKGLTQPGVLYVGNPATAKKQVELGAYGTRAVGKVPVLPRKSRSR